MKIRLSVLLVLLMLLTGTGTLHAADQADVTVEVDGRKIVFPDARPYQADSGVVVPVRAAAENMGIPVAWDAVSRSVRIGEGSQAVSFKPEQSADASQPFLKDDRVYVDLAFFKEKLGVQVDWNNEKQSVSIQTSSNVLKGVQLFKQSMVKISGEQVIYIDPFEVDGSPKDGDIIFITHTHGDHFNLEDMQKVAKDNATVVFPKKELDKLKDAGFAEVVGVAPNEEGEVKGVTFKTVPAYNVTKTNHPKDMEWLGYIVNINGASYYAAGDTDLIPEMESVDADVAFLPIGGTYTMAYEEAAEAANLIRPRIVVPYHYGDVVGTREDAIKFIGLIDPGITAILMKE